MLGTVFERFVEKSPISVMVRATLERVLGADRLDLWYERTAEKQYTRERLFSTVYDLMSQVVFCVQPSVRAASLAPEADVGTSIGNLVNTSVTSVDTSADCASGRGLRARTATLAELPIVCTPMRGGMVVGVAPWAQLGLPWGGRWAEPSPREGDVCLPR